MAKTKTEIVTTKVRATTIPIAVKDLAKWLRECLYLAVEEDEQAQRLTRIVARQLVKGNKRGEEVFHLDVPRKATDDWAESAATEIYGKLQSETANLGGLQKYALYAYHSGDNENHTSRHVIRIQGIEEDDDDDSLNSEEPNKTGLTSQAMRHAEAYAKQLVGLIMTLGSTFQSTISRQSAMIEKLMADKLEGIETMQLLMNDKEERDVRMVQAKAKARGIEEFVGKIGVLLPAIANKVTGQPIFPVRDASVTMMTRGLLTSLACDEERMKKMIGLMTTEETIAFTNLLETVSAKFDSNGMPVKGGSENKEQG